MIFRFWPMFRNEYLIVYVFIYSRSRHFIHYMYICIINSRTKTCLYGSCKPDILNQLVAFNCCRALMAVISI